MNNFADIVKQISHRFSVRIRTAFALNSHENFAGRGVHSPCELLERQEVPWDVTSGSPLSGCRENYGRIRAISWGFGAS
jgi:hypothetical protein